MKDTIGSNVIVSSLSCGLPVLASRVGSISDYVDDGENGYLFDTTDEVTSIINRLSEDESLLKYLSKNARNKAESISLSNFITFFERDNRIC